MNQQYVFDYKSKENLEPRIAEINTRFTFDYPYYNEILLMTQITESTELPVPTMGVRATYNGFVMNYHPEFLDKVTDGGLAFVLIHEIFHILMDHHRRTINGGYKPQLSNIAQDMIINTLINREIIANDNKIEIPKNEKGENWPLFIPKEYKGEENFDDLYDFLQQKADEMEKQNGGSGNDSDSEENEGSGDGGQQKSNYGKNGKDDVECHSVEDILKNYNNDETNGMSFDAHLEDEIPEDVKKQMVEDMINRIKQRGYDKGNFDKILQQLRKPKKDYLRLIKKAVQSLKGQFKNKTWSRANRRQLPLKGHRKLGFGITCILDTSGSMSNEFEKCLSYIFQNNIEIQLIQCDTEVRVDTTVKNKKELEKMKIKGLGGTIMMPAITHAIEKYPKNNILLLTDGYTDDLSFSGFKGKALILTTDNECPISVPPMKGIQQIIIEKD